MDHSTKSDGNARVSPWTSKFRPSQIFQHIISPTKYRSGGRELLSPLITAHMESKVSNVGRKKGSLTPYCCQPATLHQGMHCCLNRTSTPVTKRAVNDVAPKQLGLVRKDAHASSPKEHTDLRGDGRLQISFHRNYSTPLVVSSPFPDVRLEMRW